MSIFFVKSKNTSYYHLNFPRHCATIWKHDWPWPNSQTEKSCQIGHLHLQQTELLKLQEKHMGSSSTGSVFLPSPKEGQKLYSKNYHLDPGFIFSSRVTFINDQILILQRKIKVSCKLNSSFLPILLSCPPLTHFMRCMQSLNTQISRDSLQTRSLWQF